MDIDINNRIPVKGVVPLSQMIGGDDVDTNLLRMMASGAENYVRCFPWCKAIREAYFGDGYGGIVAVFLFRIEPARADIDEWLWVLFGDVPPAYLVTDVCKTPSQALETYVEEMSRWIQLAKQGRSSAGIIPVYVPATPENAADLENRMKVLCDAIVPAFRDAEKGRA
ncbi:MAG: hypothetical protein ABSF98_20275 [Bryobacteraceae bacterium]